MKATFNGRQPTMEVDLQWKTTSNRRGPPWKNTSNRRIPPMEEYLQWKNTSNGRWPQNIKSVISQQLLIGSFSNLKLKHRGPNQNWKLLTMKTTSNGSWPQNIKVEYLSNHLLDLPQLLNLSLGDLRWKQPHSIKSDISQQPLIISSSKLKLNLLSNLPYMNRWKKCQQACHHQAGLSTLFYLDQTCQCNTGHWSVTKPAWCWQVTGQFSAVWELFLKSAEKS